MEQLKATNEGIQTKVCLNIYLFLPISCSLQIKNLNAAKAKTQFKSIAEVDAHIEYVGKYMVYLSP